MGLFKKHTDRNKLASKIYEKNASQVTDEVSKEDLAKLAEMQARQIASRQDDFQDYQDELLCGNLLDFEQ